MIEELFIKELPQLSIATIAIISIIWFVSKSQDAMKEREKLHQEQISEMQTMMCEERKTFVSYVDEHNHVFTDLVKQCTQSITSATENMKQNTEVLREVSEIIKQTRKYN